MIFSRQLVGQYCLSKGEELPVVSVLWLLVAGCAARPTPPNPTAPHLRERQGHPPWAPPLAAELTAGWQAWWR